MFTLPEIMWYCRGLSMIEGPGKVAEATRSTTLNGPALVGPRSALNNNTSVSHSTLGADCSIGPNSTIVNSYIFDDVRIGANCYLEQCMVGKGVHLADGVRVGRGVLIGDGVHLSKGVEVPAFARVGRVPYRSEDDSDEEDEGVDEAQALGEGQKAYLWPQEEEEAESDSDDDADDPFEHPRNKRLLQLGRTLSNVSESTQSLSTLSKASSPPESPITVASGASGLDMPSLSLDDGPPAAFYTEARASLARAYEEGHAVENARLELRTLVMGYNAGVDRARTEVDNFLMSQVKVEGGAAKALQSATAVWGRWGDILEGLAPDLTNVALDIQVGRLFAMHTQS